MFAAALGCGGVLAVLFGGGSANSLAVAGARGLFAQVLALHIRTFLLAQAIPIAGAGLKRGIDVLPVLVARYGGPAAEWVKMVQRGQLAIPFADKALQLHCYFNRVTGAIADLKIKLIEWKR